MVLLGAIKAIVFMAKLSYFIVVNVHARIFSPLIFFWKGWGETETSM